MCFLWVFLVFYIRVRFSYIDLQRIELTVEFGGLDAYLFIYSQTKCLTISYHVANHLQIRVQKFIGKLKKRKKIFWINLPVTQINLVSRCLSLRYTVFIHSINYYKWLIWYPNNKMFRFKINVPMLPFVYFIYFVINTWIQGVKCY